MTVKEVRARVEAIEQSKHDPEVAHGLEDNLYRTVLHVIGHKRLGIKEQRAIAREALKTQEIDFARWAA